MSQKRSPLGPGGHQGSSSGTKLLKLKSPIVDEPQLDLISAVNKFHVLSSTELGKLIREAENGTIIWTNQNGSYFEINVESLARHLGKHITEQVLSFEQDEEHFKYLLSGLRLLHTLYDIAPHHSKLEEVLVEDLNVGTEILDLIFSMIIFLSHVEEETIEGSSQMVLLYPALLASSLYLLKALISLDWQTITLFLLAHAKIDDFTVAAFTSLIVATSFLEERLPAQHIDSHNKSKVNNVFCLFQLCEASLQFLQSLCKQMLFREHLVKNKELCEEGVVLQLVETIMNLQPQCEDPHLIDVVYRLKSKVLSIMLLLCEVKSPSFLTMCFSTTQSLELAESTVFEVLEVVKMMFYGDLRDHPRGILQLNAMQLTEMFSGDSRFRNYIVFNLTEALIRVFFLPQIDFLNTWCSNDGEPAEEDVVMEFDPVSAAGQVLGFNSISQVRHSTWSNFQAPQTPYAHQRSSLLVKILANLTCFVPSQCEEEKDLFINEFLECLQREFSKLPVGADKSSAVASKNLSSLLTHAKSLTPECLNVEHVHALRHFIGHLEQQLADQQSDIHRVMDVHNKGQCPSPTPQTQSPNEHDGHGIDNECGSGSLAMIQPDQLTFKDNGQNQSNDMTGEDQTTDLDDNNIETVNGIKGLEVFASEQSEETQQKKRKRSKMNDEQIEIIENALLDQPDLQKTTGSLQLLADKLSLHGSEVTRSQLRNWLNNRKARLARSSAKDARGHSDSDNALTEKQTGSGSILISDSSESPNDEDNNPNPSVPHGTHQKDPKGSVSRIRGAKTTTQDTVVVPTYQFKRQVGQYVMLTNQQGEKIGTGIINMVRGIWFGNNLEELGLCVVDVDDLKLKKWTPLPHPTDILKTFLQAEIVLGKMRILWDSSQLLLIKQQMRK